MRRQFPAAALIAVKTGERDTLAGDRAAVQVERLREIERALAEKRGESLEREERLGSRADDDAAVAVLGDEAAVGEPARVGLDPARAVARHQQRIGDHGVLGAAQRDVPVQAGEIADPDRTGRGDERTVVGDVVPRPEPRAGAHDRRIGRAVVREIAAVDDERGAELAHPPVEVAVAGRRVAHGETEMRRVDAGEQDAVDLAAIGDDRKLADIEPGRNRAPGERPGRDGTGRIAQRQTHRRRQPRVVGRDRHVDPQAAAEEDVEPVGAGVGVEARERQKCEHHDGRNDTHQHAPDARRMRHWSAHAASATWSASSACTR